MERKKIMNLLDSTQNQPPKIKTKNWVEINDNWRGTYSTNSQTSVSRPSLCDYSNAHIAVKGTITVPNTGTASVWNNVNKQAIYNAIDNANR